MSAVSRALFSFAVLVTAAGGCATEDEDIWMPPTAEGKADGITTIPGSTIPSTNVDPNKDYLSSRKIDTLVQVGALTDDVLAVAMRADGIIANLPANGRIEAAELARMENPQIYATLFPNEQAALPKIWPLLLAPSGNAGNVPAPAPNLMVVDKSTAPSMLHEPASIAISSLATELQQVARRVQLVFNGDNNANTIQRADIESVLMDPQAFTPAEVDQLKRILVEFLARATSDLDARAQVPKPGKSTSHKAFGQATVTYDADVVLHESRAFCASSSNYAPYHSAQWRAYLYLEVTASATLAGPADDSFILLGLDDGTETVLGGGTTQLPDLAGGSYALERYEMGARKESHLAVLPALSTRTVTTDLSQYIDYTLVTSTGTQLVKNATLATSDGWLDSVDFHWDTTTMTNPTVNTTWVDAVATPPFTVPAGRYEFATQSGTVMVDMYPQGVAKVALGGPSVAMVPDMYQSGSSGEKIKRGNVSGYSAQLTFGGAESIEMWGNSTILASQLTPDHRTK